MEINGVIVNSIVGVLVIPFVYLSLHIMGGIYFYIRRKSGALAANVALPLIFVLILYYDISIMISLMHPGAHGVQCSILCGVIYTGLVHILICNGALAQKRRKVFHDGKHE